MNESTEIERAICDELCSGTSSCGGKNRILKFFAEDHSSKERADFLKREYGTGGHSPFCSEFSVCHDAKGIRFRRGSYVNPDVDFTLSWANVASRIADLIASGLYS